MSFQASAAAQADYTSGRPTAGFDRSTDSTTSSVAAADDLASLQARLNLMAELTYSMPQADAGTYLDRITSRWYAPASVVYGTSPGASQRIDFTIDFAGHYPDISTHFFCFTLKTGRVPGAQPGLIGDRQRLFRTRRYEWRWDAHHNSPFIMMRIANLSRLIERLRITTNGGQVIEEADQVELACEIRLRAQASAPPPRVHWLYCPAPLPHQTGLVDKTTGQVRGPYEDYVSGRSAVGTSIAGTSNIYAYNPPSVICNPCGMIPPQDLYGASGAPVHETTGVAVAGTYGYDPTNASAVRVGGLLAARSSYYRQIPPNLAVEATVAASIPTAQLNHNADGYFRPVVLDSFRERGWYGVDILDDVELQYQCCSNVMVPAAGSSAVDGTEIGRRFKMKLPAQFMNRQPILPDLKSLRFEIFLAPTETAFQGIGSAPSYQTRALPQNCMHDVWTRPADWWYEVRDISLECECVDLAPTLRASIQKGMSEGGLPLHWTQWSFAGDNIGRSETFFHSMQRNVANVVACVSVFRSPRTVSDWRWDSYRFLNPNLRTAQWRLGTSQFPPVPLEGVENFFTSLRQCFPMPADALGRIDRIDFEGERSLHLSGAFFAAVLPAAAADAFASTWAADTLFRSSITYSGLAGGVYGEILDANGASAGSQGRRHVYNPTARVVAATVTAGSLLAQTVRGYRGVISYRAPHSFILARCFQTARGIDLTGLSTLQGQQLQLMGTRYSGTVNLRSVAVDFDPGAQHAFLSASRNLISAAEEAKDISALEPGFTSAGVSSLRNLSRDLYIPFTAMWLATASGVAITSASNGTTVGANLLSHGTAITQSFLDLSALTNAASLDFSGCNSNGIVDFANVLDRRNGTSGLFEQFTSDDLAVSTFVLHTRVVLLGTQGNVTARE